MYKVETFVPGEVIASAHNITKGDHGQTRIKGISLRVHATEFAIITGPSGSGKSTLLRSFEGLEKPDDGTVLLAGKDLYAMSPSDRQKLKGRLLGQGHQSPNIMTGLTVADNIASYANSLGTFDRRHKADLCKRAGRMAVIFGLDDKLDRFASTLSGGEKQRLALARLLVPKPTLVLLDEPTGGIDPHGKAGIFEALREINQEEGTTFLVVTHDNEVAREYADREISMNSGQLIQDVSIYPPLYPAA